MKKIVLRHFDTFCTLAVDSDCAARILGFGATSFNESNFVMDVVLQETARLSHKMSLFLLLGQSHIVRETPAPADAAPAASAAPATATVDVIMQRILSVHQQQQQQITQQITQQRETPAGEQPKPARAASPAPSPAPSTGHRVHSHVVRSVPVTAAQDSMSAMHRGDDKQAAPACTASRSGRNGAQLLF